MHITVFGATSITGKQLVLQALAKGWQVTAFDRDVRSLIDKDLRTQGLHAIKGYVFDSGNIAEALQQADAVVSLIGGGLDATDHSRSLGTRTIIQQMEKRGLQRIIALGNYGVLDAGDRYILDTPDYPAVLHNVAQEYLLVYQFLASSSLNWTLVCPAKILDENGKRQYRTAAATPPAPDTGEIAAGDLADFILNELSNEAFLRQRVGISR